MSVWGQLNAADEMGKMAQRLSLPVEELSTLRYAAELSGLELSELETSMRRLSQQMAQAPDDFAAVGVAVRGSDGVMRDATDVLADLADSFAAMPEGAEKAAAAMDIFGRSGTAMLPLLNSGADGLAAMQREAEAMGLMLSGETAQAAAALNDNLTRLSRTFSGIFTQIAGELAPVLGGFSDTLVNVSRAFHDLSPEGRRFAAVLAGVAVAAGPVIVGVGLLATGIAAIGVPMAAAIAGMAALGAGVAALWPHLVELKDRGLEALADLSDGFWSMKESASLAAMQAVQWVQDEFTALMDWFRGLPAQMVQIGRDIIQGLADGIFERWEAVKGRVTGVADGLIAGFNDIFRRQSPSRVFMDMGADLMEGLRIGIADNLDGPVRQMETLADSLAGAWGNFANRLIGNFKDIRGALAGLAGDLARTFGRRALGALFPSLGIPGFANGTSFAPGGLALVGERGPELVNLPRGSSVLPAARTRQAMSNPGTVRVVIEEGPMFAARVRTEATGVAVETARAGLSEFSRSALPQLVQQINRDPRRRG